MRPLWVDEFVDSWTSHWKRMDIDAMAAHFAIDGEMRSPLAAATRGTPVITGREAIRQYWHHAYVGVEDPQLAVEASSWDEQLQRLIVWWSAKPRGVPTRACEFMDFGLDRLIWRGEAFYGDAG